MCAEGKLSIVSSDLKVPALLLLPVRLYDGEEQPLLRKVQAVIGEPS